MRAPVNAAGAVGQWKRGTTVGEWMEAYIEGKNKEPDHLGDMKPTLRKCWGVMDRQGKCENTFISAIGVYCDECRRYFDSGEWKRNLDKLV